MPVNVGDKHGCLTALRRLERTPNGSYNWLYRCDCGGEFVCRSDRVANGNTVGCPACRRKRIGQKSLHHGGCVNNQTTRLYGIWRGMRARCRNKNTNGYHNYGGKGIGVCDEWQAFQKFETWALQNGYTDELTIERKNPERGYSPSNCEWITRGENTRRAQTAQSERRTYILLASMGLAKEVQALQMQTSQSRGWGA